MSKQTKAQANTAKINAALKKSAEELQAYQSKYAAQFANGDYRGDLARDTNQTGQVIPGLENSGHWDEEQDKLLTKMYEQGFSCDYIACKVHHSMPTVWSRAHRTLGLERKGRIVLTPEMKQDIRARKSAIVHAKVIALKAITSASKASKKHTK